MQTLPLPGLQSKHNLREHIVLFPDHTFQDWQEDETPGWAALQYLMRKAADLFPWAGRLPQVFFRGSSKTGGALLLHWHPCTACWGCLQPAKTPARAEPPVLQQKLDPAPVRLQAGAAAASQVQLQGTGRPVPVAACSLAWAPKQGTG